MGIISEKYSWATGTVDSLVFQRSVAWADEFAISCRADLPVGTFKGHATARRIYCGAVKLQSESVCQPGKIVKYADNMSYL